MEKKEKLTVTQKTVQAMGFLYNAAQLLREAGDEVSGAEQDDFRYFELEIRKILIDGHGDAGLEPFVRGMKARRP